MSTYDLKMTNIYRFCHIDILEIQFFRFKNILKYCYVINKF
jgi:hypothetical protein